MCHFAVYTCRPNPFYPSSIHSKSKDSSVAGSLESSYALWTPRDSLATDTIAGALALELEVVRERLRWQTCSAARAEAALSSMAVNSKVRSGGKACGVPCCRSAYADACLSCSTQSAQESLTAQVEDMKAELAHLRSKKREMEGEVGQLHQSLEGVCLLSQTCADASLANLLPCSICCRVYSMTGCAASARVSSPKSDLPRMSLCRPSRKSSRSGQHCQSR